VAEYLDGTWSVASGFRGQQPVPDRTGIALPGKLVEWESRRTLELTLPVAAVRIEHVTVEQCQECGFNGDDWSDVGALEALVELPSRWAIAVSGLTFRDANRRPVLEMWSVAEYADHVREVLFGMRFLLETTISQPGTDLGPSPETRFDAEPRQIEVKSALDGIDRESTTLRASISELPATAWESTIILDDTGVDPHWIVRHAVHDATHHLLDVQRLRKAL
jgi:hypothetical protein